MSGFWRGKRVAVAGGAGFIGSFLVERLVEAGADVSLSQRSARFPDFYEAVGDAIRIVECDLEDSDACRSFVEGQEIVMYLAASVGGISFNMKHPASIFQDNIRPFLNTIEAAKDARVERFLVTSSACVYPRFCTIPTPETEGFVDLPEPTNVGYGMAKRVEEFVGRTYAEEFGMRVAIARPYNAYGPRDNFEPERSHVIPALIRRIFKEKEDPLVVWGSGNQTRSFLYVTDFARGLMEVTERYPEADPVNLGAEEEVTVRELVHKLIRIQGGDVEVRFDESRPEGQPRRACDTTKARTRVGFQAQVPLGEGLQRTVDWFLREQ
jgi:GDP-L-fucose synthase